MRLIPAVLLTALLGVVYWVGATIFTDRIQNDITERTNEAVAQVNPDVDLSVDGRDVTLTGLVNTEHERERATETVDSVWGVRASRSLLEVRDGYDFNATHSRDQGLHIDGTVDSDEAVSHLRQAIDPVVPSGSVETNGRPMIRSPEKLALGAGALLMLNKGGLKIDEDQFVLTGEAEDDQIKAAIENNLANQQNVIDPLNLITEIDVANNMTQACRSMLEAVANNGTILFAVDSAVVVDDFHNVVESHANLLGTCPGILLVEAHADHDGSENYNLELSKRRANAVADAIAFAGAGSERIQVFAYGETRPVASNESRSDKTYNRRVNIQYVHDTNTNFLTLQQPIISSQSAE